MADTMEVRVSRVVREAIGTKRYELVDPDRGALPGFTAGAHIDVLLPGPIMRQFSLCNDPAERHRYVIAVYAERGSKGGSRLLHREVHAGDRLVISHPRNRFPLSEGRPRYLLLAGGIGVTPLLSMAYRLATLGAEFTLHYCTKSPRHTAFRTSLDDFGGAVHLHHDAGDPARGLDIRALLETRPPGAQLYYCGPLGFMHAVRKAAAHWPDDSVHCEYFAAEPSDGGEDSGLDHFAVRDRTSGRLYPVGPGQSIVAALRDSGAATDPPCESGRCGICRRHYSKGEPVHRDSFLTESERSEFVLLCRARSRSPVLEIEL
jgi:vanillate O-demethylase ferredoxin subunit